MISARMIADSTNKWGSRLSTILCRYPLIIHNEVMTHRDFSRNSASSRAIPVTKMIEDVRAHPFVPVIWSRNQPGMQGYEPLPIADEYKARQAWHEAMKNAIQSATELNNMGVHKQVVNRLLMPFMFTTVLISSTRWANFLALRLHKAAEPHIRILADHIDDALRGSVPQMLADGEMHLPFITAGERYELSHYDLIRLSVARCASTSYKTVDGFDMSLSRARTIHDNLLEAVPVHASPAEHVAEACDPTSDAPKRHGNFHPSWIQYRKTLAREYVTLDDWLTLRTDEDFRPHAETASN